MHSNPSKKTMPKAVVFLTTTCDDTIPNGDHSMACLLPAGWCSFAERVMCSCALAGITHIDVVCCENPELLRQLLGQGERWGLQLNWHLVKDGHTPYGVLRQLAVGAERLLIGHAHQWIDGEPLAELLEADGAAIVLEPALRWAGWVAVPAAFAGGLSPHADAAALAQQVMGLPAQRCVSLSPHQHLSAGNAQELLAVQQACLAPPVLALAPASWTHTRWGLVSPDALVSPQAVINGPVLIGPGCLVEKDAVVGPYTVLCDDVMVCSGAQVESSVVLAGTYVGGGITLSHAVVQGSVAHHVTWGATLELPIADAVITPVRRAEHGAGGAAALCGRLLAGAALLAALPVLAVASAAALLRGQTPGWRQGAAVRGWNADGSLQTTPVRQARPPSTRTAALLGAYGALLDVAQGRRAWFGVRARAAGDWYALSRDWQRLLARQPVGFFHARAWAEEGVAGSVEALAAADAYFAAARTGRERLAVLSGAVQSWRPRVCAST